MKSLKSSVSIEIYADSTSNSDRSSSENESFASPFPTRKHVHKCQCLCHAKRVTVPTTDDFVILLHDTKFPANLVTRQYIQPGQIANLPDNYDTPSRSPSIIIDSHKNVSQRSTRSGRKK